MASKTLFKKLANTFIFEALLYVTALLMLGWLLNFVFAPKPSKNEGNINLTVKVSDYGIPQSSIDNRRVRVSKRDDPNVYWIRDTSNAGEVVFRLDSGIYRVEMESGYSGFEEIVLDKDTTINLKVLQILN